MSICKSKGLTVKDIASLGGVQEDLQLVGGTEDDDDELEEIEFAGDRGSDSDEGEQLSKKELQKFVKELGFEKVGRLTIIKDSEDDSAADATKEPPKCEEDRDDVKKKPRGNKFKTVDDKQDSTKKKPPNTIGTLIGPPKEPKIRNYTLVKPNRKWYENEVTDFPSGKSSEEQRQVDRSVLSQYEEYAARLLEEDIALYKKHQGSSKNRSNFHFTQTVLKSGTTADKMAAYIVLIQDSPVHNLSVLENLVDSVDAKAKRECLMAVDTLKDIFKGDLLLENKKLHKFDQQPFELLSHMTGSGNRDSHDKLLILWYFESRLKSIYLKFLSALDKMSHDALEVNKRKAIRIMQDLLVNNPEQEQVLLKYIVNKVGDPHPKVASQCSMLLGRLLDVHPNMKAVVTGEVERLLFRRNVADKARYYGVCFLNQMLLDPEDTSLAAKLIAIYLGLFKEATKKGAVESKMMSALLTGVNRAFPFAKLDQETLGTQIDVIYKIVHTVNFNVGIQALMLLFHILDAKNDFTDRFYGSLYRKLLDPELKRTSKQSLFLNLLFKAVKRDPMERRALAFIKRIFQIAADQTPAMLCGFLFLVSEVSRLRPLPLKLKNSWSEMDDDEDETFVDVTLPSDDDETPVKGNGRTPRQENVKTEVEPPSSSSWVHRSNASAQPSGYNPFHRNPLYAGAESCCLWELLTLKRHFHPSAALFANTLLEGRHIEYDGDPMRDYTLLRFLDRFVYRNPKKTPPESETAGGQQRAVLGKRRYYLPKGARAMAVNSAGYVQKAKEAIPADELFFHKYFVQQKEKLQRSVVPGEDEDEDVESVASDEFDRLLDRFEPGAANEEFDLDYAGEVKKNSQKRAQGKKKYEDEEEDEEEEDEEVEFEDEDFGDAFKDYDEDIREAKMGNAEEEEELDLSDGEAYDDEEDDVFDESPSKSKRRTKEFDPAKVFASAEEFSTMLDDNINCKYDTIGLEAMANKDNAHVKQLRWEQDRDRWVKGIDWKSRKRSQQKEGPFGRKKKIKAAQGKPLNKMRKKKFKK